MKKLEVSKILVLSAIVTLMACGATQTDQSEGLNQQDTSSLKASPRTEGGGHLAAPSEMEIDEGGGHLVEPSEKEIDEGGGHMAAPSEKELEEGGGHMTAPSEMEIDEGGGHMTAPSEMEIDEGGGHMTAPSEMEIDEGGGHFTLEGNVLVLRGTMPKGATEGLLLINGKDYIKLQMNKDGTFVMKIELSDEDLKEMGFQTVFQKEVSNYILKEGKITKVEI